jgi:hypothetical protein
MRSTSVRAPANAMSTKSSAACVAAGCVPAQPPLPASLRSVRAHVTA